MMTSLFHQTHAASRHFTLGQQTYQYLTRAAKPIYDLNVDNSSARSCSKENSFVIACALDTTSAGTLTDYFASCHPSRTRCIHRIFGTIDNRSICCRLNSSSYSVDRCEIVPANREQWASSVCASFVPAGELTLFQLFPGVALLWLCFPATNSYTICSNDFDSHDYDFLKLPVLSASIA